MYLLKKILDIAQLELLLGRIFVVDEFILSALYTFVFFPYLIPHHNAAALQCGRLMKTYI